MWTCCGISVRFNPENMNVKEIIFHYWWTQSSLCTSTLMWFRALMLLWNFTDMSDISQQSDPIFHYDINVWYTFLWLGEARSNNVLSANLTHCGLVTLYSIDLCPHCLMAPSYYLNQMSSCHHKGMVTFIRGQFHKRLITKIILIITDLKFCSNLAGGQWVNKLVLSDPF